MAKTACISFVLAMMLISVAKAGEISSIAIEKADEYFRNGDDKSAEKVLSEAIATGQGTGDLYRNRGILEYSRNAIKEAEDDFRKAVELNEKDYASMNFMGLIFHSRGEYYEAADTFRKSIEVTPNWQAYAGRARASIATKDFGSAVDDLNIAISLVSGNDTQNVMPDLLLKRGEAYEAIGQNAAALKDFKDAADLGHSAEALEAVKRLTSTESAAVQNKVELSEEKFSYLTAAFQQYAIASLCKEADNTFSGDDVDAINSAIKKMLDAQGLANNQKIISAWGNISRQINANKSLLTQADCTQTYQWFTYSMPSVRLGASEPFPFQ